MVRKCCKGPGKRCHLPEQSTSPDQTLLQQDDCPALTLSVPRHRLLIPQQPGETAPHACILEAAPRHGPEKPYLKEGAIQRGGGQTSCARARHWGPHPSTPGAPPAQSKAQPALLSSSSTSAPAFLFWHPSRPLLDHIFQEGSGEVVIGDVARVEEQPPVRAPLLGSGQGDLAVLHHLVHAVHPAHHAHRLRGVGLLHHLPKGTTVRASPKPHTSNTLPCKQRALTRLFALLGWCRDGDAGALPSQVLLAMGTRL